MKKKLTLLIALSTIIVVMCIVTSMITIPVEAPKENRVEAVIAETPFQAAPVQPTSTTMAMTATTIVTTTTRHIQYPEADEVWRIMKSFGWSDIICAGIMGNIMRECGGDTFNINPYAENSHYGLCQWSRRYHYSAWYKDIKGQLEYLRDTLNLSIFDNCSTPEEVAETFCWNYERPSSKDPVHKRIANARKAYNYFTK